MTPIFAALLLLDAMTFVASNFVADVFADKLARNNECKNLLPYVARYRALKKWLVWHCDRTVGICGGVGNTLRGISGSLQLAVALNRRFAISWTKPVNMKEILEPNLIAW
jgi:hypothetical protein